jgi:hypothetical protein
MPASYQILAALLAVSYMGSSATAAHLTQIYLLLFLELAALSHDGITRLTANGRVNQAG